MSQKLTSPASQCLLIAFVACLLGFAPNARAQSCVSTPHERPPGVSAIGVDGSSLDSATVSDAISRWEECAGYDVSFPGFEDMGQGLFDVNVTITYYDSPNVEGNCGLWTQWGSDGREHEIELWSSITLSGQNYSCPVEDALAHELGHVLGFVNSTCGTEYMMGPVTVGSSNSDPKSVQSSECSAASDNWTTQTEQETCY